jgi:nucleotide-binding universal stress UspA family protein
MLPKNLLVPTDFSTCAETALDYACELAGKLDATVHVVNCLGASLPELNLALSEAMIESLRAGALQGLERLTRARPGVRFGKLSVVPGDPRDGILEIASSLQSDLIVMGTHGRRGFTRLVVGSVAEHVLRRAACPVLTIRGGVK